MSTRTIMGHELEYALVVLDAAGKRIDSAGLGMLEQAALCLEPSLPWEDRGIALPNGARFYRDPAGGNAHLEYATPECTNPDELARYVEAGHQFMLRAAAALRKDRRVSAVTLGASTVDYSGHPATCGSHESYFIPG